MLKGVLRWTLIVLAALAALLVLAYLVVYLQSERVLHQRYSVPTATFSVPADADSIAEGRRLAIMRGCYFGCHGKQAEGRVLFDQAMIARIVAPNLSAATRKYNDAQLSAIIRDGVRPDGRSLIVMPSEVFHDLSDAELGDIIAFLRSLPPSAGPGPEFSVGPLGRVGLAMGQFKLAAGEIADVVPPPEATDETAAWGRHLARTICAQCHGTSLRGASNPDFTSPSLQVVAAYSTPAFTQLLRTGVPPSGRKLIEMSDAARNNLSHLSDAEILALYAYLHALPDAPVHK